MEMNFELSLRTESLLTDKPGDITKGPAFLSFWKRETSFQRFRNYLAIFPKFSSFWLNFSLNWLVHEVLEIIQTSKT